MPSNKIQIRLNPDEQIMLKKICNRGGSADRHNPSEMVRLLIHREYAKHCRKRNRENWSAIADAAIATDWRRGRPKKEQQ